MINQKRGRPATGIKRTSINISGSPEQLNELKELARKNNDTVSAYVLKKTGVIKMDSRQWFVANDDGVVAGSDMHEIDAKNLAASLNKRFWYIEYYTGADNGYVDCNGEPCNSLDYAEHFDTEAEAAAKYTELQKDWKSELRVASFQDNTWEAMDAADKSI